MCQKFKVISFFIITFFIASEFVQAQSQSIENSQVPSSVSEPSENAVIQPAETPKQATETPPTPSTPANQPPAEFKKFPVYKDKGSFNHFTISGFMPYGKCAEMNDVWQENCKEGKTCIKADFNRDCTTLSGGEGWAGVYWLQPANNWGELKGGYNLTGATKITFWARGEKGGEVLTFKMGGVGTGRQNGDTDKAQTDLITLTTDWKQYTIDLTGKNLSKVVGGFAWVGSAKNNTQNITFYLDEIYYE